MEKAKPSLEGIMVCQGWGLQVAQTTNGFVTVEVDHFASLGSLPRLPWSAIALSRQTVTNLQYPFLLEEEFPV